MQSDQSHVLCWIYSYIDPSWQNFCSALFLLPVFSCHVLSDLSGLFIFYKRFSTYTPLFSHHCTQKVSRSGIFDSLHSIFMIGICIMIFSIAVSLLEILPLPFYLKRGLTAVLEITNAISHFGSSHMSIGRKVILLCMITSFGGLSAAVQTLSVYKKSRLSLWKYLLIRSLFSVSSGLLAYLVFI